MDWNLENHRARARDTGLLLLVLEAVTISLSVVMIVLSFLQLAVVQRAASGQYPRVDLASDAARIQGYQTPTSFLLGAAMIATGVTFLLWVYRSNIFARALGATSMQHTPGWSVGWFLIPLANLIKPYFVIKEIYLATCSPRDHSMAHNEPDGLKTVQLWWLLVLADRLFAAATMIYSIGLTSLDKYVIAATMTTISGCLSLLVGLMTVALVLEFRQQQEFDRRRAFSPVNAAT